MRYLYLMLSIGVFVFGGLSAVAQTKIGTISDLPPAVVNGTRHDIDLIINAAPASQVILQLCKVLKASCTIVGAPNTLLGYSCSGSAEICWRTFMNGLQHSGMAVIVQPSIIGASYVFYSSGGGFSSPVGNAADAAESDESSEADQ